MMSSLRLMMSCGAILLASSAVWAAGEADEWKAVNSRKDVLFQTLQDLQKKFKATESEEEQKKLAEEFEAARTEFVSKVLPKLAELAPKVFAADPKNFDAGETALEFAFQDNQYDQSAKLADQLLTAGDESMIVRNMGGISLFAKHEFAKAHEWLAAADKKGELHPQLGARYLESTLEYGPLWEKEQVIRAKEAKLTGEERLPQVKFATNKGDIIIELFENEAPNTVANFISLVESKTYDGCKFHRVIPTFMAQGGDPLSKDKDPRNDGTGGPGYAIKCECYRPDARMHFRGSLSMAHAGKDSGGSQFFITHLPTAHLNPSAEEERGHTVFGRVIEGLEIAAGLKVGDTIESATVLHKRNHPYKPETLPDPRGE